MNKNLTTIILVLIATGLTSCSNYYRITSHIHSDGSMYREVYAKGDSAFRAGNMEQNPFLFPINSGWELTKLDSIVKFNFWGEEQSLNVKVSRTLSAVGDPCFETLEGKAYMKPLVVPQENLKREFKWFHTIYIYKAVYKELPDKGPIPLSKYMTQEEQYIWFQGSGKLFARMNGMEQNNKLNELQSNFWKWYNRSLFEMCYETIYEVVALQKNAANHLQTLKESKERVYKMYFADNDSEMEDINLQTICKGLDELGKTKHFETLYLTDKVNIEARFNERSKVITLFDSNIWFEVTMPGVVVAINEYGVRQSINAVAWKVDAFRLLSGDYVLEAKSKEINYWAFFVTGLSIILVLVGSWKLSRKVRF